MRDGEPDSPSRGSVFSRFSNNNAPRPEAVGGCANLGMTMRMAYT